MAENYFVSLVKFRPFILYKVVVYDITIKYALNILYIIVNRYYLMWFVKIKYYNWTQTITVFNFLTSKKTCYVTLQSKFALGKQY